MLGACTTVVPRPAWLDGVNDAEKKRKRARGEGIA
jgi:hypothetical protein